MKGNDLWTMDISSLRGLYEKETEELHAALLSGASWEETVQYRQKLAAVYAVMYKKMNPHHFQNPAEHQNREESI